MKPGSWQLPPLPKLSRQQLARVAMVLVGLWLLVNFALEVWEYLPVRAEEMRWREAVAREEARHDALQQRLARVQTDAYVEQQARETLRMIKPGEHSVRPVFVSVGSAAEPQSTAPSVTLPTWKQWWERFFGQEAANDF